MNDITILDRDSLIQDSTPISILNEIDRIITSHSIDGTFDSCARRFEFLHMWQRAPEKEKSGFAADVGTALHEAVQAWARYALLPKDSSYSAEAKLVDAKTEGYLALLKFWPWSLEEYQKDNSKAIGERTLGNAILLYEMIIEHPFWDSWELVIVDGFGPAIEVPWAIIHTSLGPVKRPSGQVAFFVTQGKIDFLLRHRYTGEIRVFDLKTTTKGERAHEAAFKFSGQGGLYSIVLAHAIGYPWRIHGLKMSYLLAYFGTVENDMFVEPMLFEYHPEDIQDMIDVKLDRLERMRSYAIHGHWPRRAHGCDFYGSPCGFLSICERRDKQYIADWFEFEITYGGFEQYKREYLPVWTMQA